VRFVAPEGTELVAPLGRGTLGHAARVRDQQTGDELACKRLLPRSLGEPAAKSALVREATVLSKVSHPALPRLVRVGTDWAGPFVLMSLVLGLGLDALGERWAARGGVPLHLARHVAREATRALAELSRLEGFVHGDLEPGHVVLSPAGEVRFLDLGAARWRGMSDALETDDRGTLPWVDPGVARGARRPDQAGDVYALGATLLTLVTGARLARAREPAALLVEVVERGLELPSLAPGDARAPLVAALARALAPEAERVTAPALADAVEAALGG
jgi:serine/threonine protein kinase